MEMVVEGISTEQLIRTIKQVVNELDDTTNKLRDEAARLEREVEGSADRVE